MERRQPEEQGIPPAAGRRRAVVRVAAARACRAGREHAESDDEPAEATEARCAARAAAACMASAVKASKACALRAKAARLHSPAPCVAARIGDRGLPQARPLLLPVLFPSLSLSPCGRLRVPVPRAEKRRLWGRFCTPGGHLLGLYRLPVSLPASVPFHVPGICAARRSIPRVRGCTLPGTLGRFSPGPVGVAGRGFHSGWLLVSS